MLRILTVLLLLASAAPAGAESYALLGPSGEVPPEGFLVALVRRDAAGALLPLSQPPKLWARGAQLHP
ncbi:MAG TPA: hypothetical protein VFO83_06560, partial [Aggregicoccus sp.]|nr:hypothetical protein [Aggregicoccus sp.]